MFPSIKDLKRVATATHAVRKNSFSFSAFFYFIIKAMKFKSITSPLNWHGSSPNGLIYPRK